MIEKKSSKPQSTILKDLEFSHGIKNGADVLNITSNKGNALLAIKEAIGANEIICFGDGLNDFELIDVADIGVVMNNAGSQALKDKGRLDCAKY